MTVPIKNQYVESPSRPDREEVLRNSLRIGQVISFALIQGIILVSAVAVFVAAREHRAGDGVAQRQNESGSLFDSLLSTAGFGLTLAAIPTALVLRRLLRQTGSAQSCPPEPAKSATDKDKITPRESSLLAADRISVIFAQAILEGVAFFNAIVIFIAGNLWQLAAIFVLLAVMASLTPTRAKAERWLASAV